MLTRFLTPVLAVLLALAVGWAAWSQHSLQNARKQAQEAQTKAALYQGSYEQEKAVVEALRASSAQQAQAMQKRLAQAQAQAQALQGRVSSLQSALEQEKEWSNTPIPGSVRENLQDYP